MNKKKLEIETTDKKNVNKAIENDTQANNFVVFIGFSIHFILI